MDQQKAPWGVFLRAEQRKRISVGKPINNIKFYIFDKYMNLMPIRSPR